MLRIALLVLVVVVLILLIPRLISGSRAAAPAPGSTAPDFTLPPQEGSPVSLKDYRGSWVVPIFIPRIRLPVARGRRITSRRIRPNTPTATRWCWA